MQPATPLTGDVAPSTPMPGAPGVLVPAAPPRTSGGGAGSDRSRAQFRRYASTWILAVLGLIVLEVVTRPLADVAGMATLVAMTAGAGFAMMFAAFALVRDQPGRWPIVATIVIDVAALAVAFLSASGNDTALFLPFLGALLLVGTLDDRELRLAFVIQALVGVAGASVAYLLGPMRTIDGADPPIVSITATAAMSLVGYSLLWWVRDRLSSAQGDARRATADMAALVRSSAVPTIGFDLAGRIRSWNPAAETVFGWRAADIVDTDPDVMAGGNPAEAPSAVAAQVLAGASVSGRRVTWRTHDGTPLLLSLHAARLEADGVPAGVVLQAIDETEREALRTRVADAQRMEAVGQLAGGVAHDFNNLLTAIMGYAQLLEESLPDGHPARADALEIERASARGAELVRQLLAFGRRKTVDPVVLRPDALVDDLRPMLARLIGTQVRIHDQHDQGVPAVLADRGQLEQVIVNLVVNARDAMPGGGDITIRTGPLHRGPALLARITVADTGCGMDTATQARVFEPFFTTKGPGRGTGLGLATVYGVVRDHDGTVSLVSAPGRGTSFHVDLPAAAERPAAPVAAPAPAVEARVGTGTVLVVDDEETVRRLASRALAASGYRVLEASDLWSAVHVAGREEGSIDLILSDVVMPDCRGPELARRIARFHPEARVLYMSGFDDDALDGALAGAIDGPVLLKPFSVPELARAVAARLADAHPEA